MIGLLKLAALNRLLRQFQKLGLPHSEYTIIGSAPMFVRGLRPSIHDLDVVVSRRLFNKLAKQYPIVIAPLSGSKSIRIGDIELFTRAWPLSTPTKKLIERSDIIEGLKFMNLQDLIRWKQKLGREKDIRDIEIIKQYLNL